MVINKLFGKKDSKAGIDDLKERFSKVSQAPQTEQSQPTVQVQDAIDQQPSAQQFSQVSPQPQMSQGTPQQVSQPNVPQQQTQTFGQQPLGMAPTAQPLAQQAPQQLPVHQSPQPVPQQMPQASPQSSFAQQPIPQVVPIQEAPQTAATDLPSWAVESAGEEIAQEISGTSRQNKAQQTLEQIEDKYYDAKLNSLIIDQVKELIEIDNNLSQRIDDIASEIKKEIEHREKLATIVDTHFEKVKELEGNMEKFLGLYEMVTNQFNPFVDKGSSEMFLDDVDKKYPNPVVPDPEHPTVPVRAPKTDMTDPIPPELRAPVTQQPSVHENISQTAPAGEWVYCPIHHSIHPSLHFELSNGQKLSSIYDVLAVLEQMDDETFAAHVNLKQNDLSQWIYKVLGLTDLGQQLDLIKTKPEMIQSIRSYIQHKMKQANQ